MPQSRCKMSPLPSRPFWARTNPAQMEQERTHHDVGPCSRLIFVGRLYAAILRLASEAGTTFYTRHSILPIAWCPTTVHGIGSVRVQEVQTSILTASCIAPSVALVSVSLLYPSITDLLRAVYCRHLDRFEAGSRKVLDGQCPVSSSVASLECYSIG